MAVTWDAGGAAGIGLAAELEVVVMGETAVVENEAVEEVEEVEEEGDADQVVPATVEAAHLKACVAPIHRAVEGILRAQDKADEAVLAKVYGKTGLMVWLDKFLTAGGVMTDLASKGTRAYDLLSNTKRVHGRFGAVQPPRFTAWSCIVKAVKLDDATLAGMETLDQASVVEAVKAARPERPASAAQDGNSQEPNETVPVHGAPIGLLISAALELAARIVNGESLTDEEAAAALRMADLITKKLG